MAGRQKYTTEQIIEALAEKKGLVYLAAEKLGCAPLTIYRRAERVAAVAQAIKDARGKLVDTAEQKLWGAVEDREPWAVSMVLKTLGKDRGYVERQELTGKDGKPLFDLTKLSDRELDQFERLAEKASELS